MESRRLYRELEEVIDTGRFASSDYPHSPLSKALRFRFREHRDLKDIYTANFVSVSALGSHRKIDIDSAQELQSEMLDDVLRHVPYFKTRADSKNQERERAVELFNEVASVMEEFSKVLFKSKPESESKKVDIESV